MSTRKYFYSVSLKEGDNYIQTKFFDNREDAEFSFITQLVKENESLFLYRSCFEDNIFKGSKELRKK